MLSPVGCVEVAEAIGRKGRTKAMRARILRWRPRFEEIEIGIAGLRRGTPGFERARDDLIAMLSDEELEGLTDKGQM